MVGYNANRKDMPHVSLNIHDSLWMTAAAHVYSSTMSWVSLLVDVIMYNYIVINEVTCAAPAQWWASWATESLQWPPHHHYIGYVYWRFQLQLVIYTVKTQNNEKMWQLQLYCHVQPRTSLELTRTRSHSLSLVCPPFGSHSIELSLSLSRIWVPLIIWIAQGSSPWTSP